jgi:3-oxoacyl-[acyl-carrier-protein] synthase-3
MYMTSTGAQRALVTCSEQFSRRVRPGSKGELLCADAAGAGLLEREEGARGLVDSVVHSDGDRADVIGARPPKGWVRSQHDLPEHAVESIVGACDSIMRRNGVSVEDIDWVIPHPGTDVVHGKVKAALGVPDEKFVVNFERFGNTSSASIPIVLAEERERGRLRDGDLVLSPAIGAGWYYGALLYVVG